MSQNLFYFLLFLTNIPLYFIIFFFMRENMKLKDYIENMQDSKKYK